MSTVEQTQVDAELDAQIAAIADEYVDELFEGQPEFMSEPGNESEPIEQNQEGVDPALKGVVDGKVLVRNIQFPNEVVFLPKDGKFTGRYVQFIEGSLICDEADVDAVLAACPYARVEPRQGHVHTHAATNFSTRVPEIYDQYVERHYANL